MNNEYNASEPATLLQESEAGRVLRALAAGITLLPDGQNAVRILLDKAALLDYFTADSKELKIVKQLLLEHKKEIEDMRRLDDEDFGMLNVVAAEMGISSTGNRRQLLRDVLNRLTVRTPSGDVAYDETNRLAQRRAGANKRPADEEGR